MELQKHFVRIDERNFKRKPMDKEVGSIHNVLKRPSANRTKTVKRLLEHFLSGHTVKACKYIDNVAISTSLVFIDVDDDSNTVKLQDMIKLFSGRLSAYYHSYSYNYQNSRFRLIFQLEKEVPIKLHSYIVKRLIKEIEDYYRGIEISDYVDVKASMRASNLWFGTNKGGEIVDEKARISELYIKRCAKEFQEKYKKELEKYRLKQRTALSYGDEIPFDELKVMAETIGGIVSGAPVEWFNGKVVSSFDAWSRLILAIRSYEKEGFITYNEAFQLAEIVSGDGLSTKEFDKFSPRNETTIATFIKYAQEKGFHFNNSFDRDSNEYTLDTYDLKAVDGYVSKDDIKTLLQKDGSMLVDAPTGSGKTYATVNAMKELANISDGHIYVMALPTRALARQVAINYDIPLVVGGTNNNPRRLAELWQRGERVFAAVYDQVHAIVEHTNANDLVLVVDEVHKLTTDRGFRKDTIQKVVNVSNQAKTFIGISGTTADVYEPMFDEKYTVRGANEDIPASSFKVLKYSTQVNGQTDKRMEILPIIQTITGEYKTNGIRSLVFINNKALINDIADELKERGMQVLKVYRDDTGKDSEAYHRAVNNDLNGVDVILATSIIADGVSLSFDTIDWNTIIVSDNRSQIFNPNEVRQMFHRIRTPYRNAILIIRESTAIDEAAKPYYKNRHLKLMEVRAKRIQEYMNVLDDVKDDDLYNVERRYGLYTEDGTVYIDMNVLNSEVVREKEKYYARKHNRDLFVNQVSKVIRKQPDVINFNDVAKNKSVLDKLLDTIALDDTEDITPEMQVENFEKFYTKSVHKALHNNDVEGVFGINARDKKVLQELCGKARINAAVEFSRAIGNYEKAKANLIDVTRDNERGEFRKRLTIRNQFNRWSMRKRRTYTHQLYDELLPLLEGREWTRADLKQFALEQAQRLKVTVKDIELVLEYFTTIRRLGRSRQAFYRFIPFDVRTEASKYRLTVEEFNRASASIMTAKEMDKYVQLFEVQRSR